MIEEKVKKAKPVKFRRCPATVRLFAKPGRPLDHFPTNLAEGMLELLSKLIKENSNA
jgi:hypothetical protein